MQSRLTLVPGLVSAFEQDLLHELNTLAEVRTAGTGAVLVRPGDTLTCVPLLLEGTLKISRQDQGGDQEVLLYYLRQGDLCVIAHQQLLAAQRSSILATATEPVTLLMIRRELITEWQGRFASWRHFVHQAYQQRFQALIDSFDSLAFQPLSERLWAYLRAKAALTESRCLRIRQLDIAYDLNVSREAVTRQLKHLKEAGLLTLARNTICLVV